MIPEDKILLACTRKNFLDEHQKAVLEICSKQTIKWELVYSTALQHQVAPLIYFNLLQCAPLSLKIPSSILNQFQLNYEYWLSHKKIIAEDLNKILSFFKKKAVDVMLLKGVALELLIYNDCPGYVPGDVDLLLKNKRENVTDKEDEEDVNFFNELNKNKNFTYIEWERFEHHDVSMNGMIPINFQKIWDEARKIKFENYDVLIMSPEFLLLTACINSARKRFFRLKSLCDIAEIINVYSDIINWEQFTSNARDYQCQNLVYTALFITSITVGSQLPDKILNNLAHSSIKTTVIRYLGQYLTESVPLASFFPFSGMAILGRKIGVSSILPLVTYNWHQFGRKIMFALNKRDNVGLGNKGLIS